MTQPKKKRRGRQKLVRKPRVVKDLEKSDRMKAWAASPEGRAFHERRVALIKSDPTKTRSGVPDGYTKETIKPVMEKVRAQADRFIQRMTDEGILPEIPTTDEAKGIAALHEATVIALGPGAKQEKLAAIRTVLEWTRSKPESKSKLTVSTSEELLAQIAEDL